MSSPRITLGKTGLEVSRICFGTWQLSPRFWGDVTEAAVRKAMNAAFDLGVDFFDTADAYGDGLAESVLGRALKAWPRGRVTVATKVFNHYNPDGTRYPDLSPAHIAERCEASLRRLGTDYIDVYLLHFYDPLTPLSLVAETLEKLRTAGKIRHYGVSNFNVEELRAAADAGNFAVLEPPYNFVQADAERALFPFCLSQGIAVMAYSPLHKGLLSGKYEGREAFTDFRRHHPDFQGERFARLAAAVRGLRPLADRYGLSIAQLVLAATLTHPAVHAVVVGIKDEAQIREAADAPGRTIERPDYFRIREILSLGAASKIRDADGRVK